MELGVHIADVSHYVAEGGFLDAEAYKRGTSVYFPGGVLPMLPTQLSNNVCSLLPNVDRLTLSCFMKIDRTGNVIDSRISESVINTTTRFAYNEVQKILDGNAEAIKTHKKLVPMIMDMAELTKTVEAIRRKRGEVTFDIPEPKILLDENGKIADVVVYPHELSHRIIETFMILCNETIAEKANKHAVPFVYRIHEKPDPLKVARLNDMLKPFGIGSIIDDEHPTGRDYQRLIEPLKGDVKRIISQLALRSMQKAKYREECLGHFGLGSKFYCHFTSPIRRYPDLLIHRILKDMIHRRLSSHKIEELNSFVKRASEQSTKTEITATEVEREVDALKCAQYMHERIGEKFEGTISGIAEFGVFIYLPNTVEGLCRIENLPKEGREFWNYSEKNCTMYSTNRRTLKMGDKIEVTCIGVNLSRRQIEFSANILHA